MNNILDLPPISELHVHVEGGTLTPKLIKRISSRNKMKSPEHLFDGENYIKYKNGDFFDFLKVYDEITSYLKTKEDFFEVIYDYLQRCSEEGAIYVELTCSPDHVKKNREKFNLNENITEVQEKINEVNDEEINYQEFIKLIEKAITKAKNDFGIESTILVAILRHNGPEKAKEIIEEMIKHKNKYVVGISLVGDEINHPPEKFKECFEIAKKNNLKISAHIGELGEVSKIKESIHHLPIDRIGHGIGKNKNKKSVCQGQGNNERTQRAKNRVRN
jgi:adenosine deaminase